VAAKEEDIYRALGLPFMEPELREGRREIERGLKGKLPKPPTYLNLVLSPARTSGFPGVDAQRLAPAEWRSPGRKQGRYRSNLLPIPPASQGPAFLLPGDLVHTCQPK
jgi:hypothetical protein